MPNYVPVRDGIVHTYEYGFINCSGKALPFPVHNVEVVQCDGPTCGGLVAING